METAYQTENDLPFKACHQPVGRVFIVDPLGQDSVKHSIKGKNTSRELYILYNKLEILESQNIKLEQSLKISTIVMIFLLCILLFLIKLNTDFTTFLSSD